MCGWGRWGKRGGEKGRLSPAGVEAYMGSMKPAVDPRDKVEDADAPVERGYDAWKRAKVERGLTQAQDRGAMIPVEQVLHDLKLER